MNSSQTFLVVISNFELRTLQVGKAYWTDREQLTVDILSSNKVFTSMVFTLEKEEAEKLKVGKVLYLDGIALLKIP